MIEKLPATLTDDERNARARNAAGLIHELSLVRDQKKQSASEYGEKIADLEREIAEASRAARTGIEEREIEVRPAPNADRFVVEYFREDTGEKIRERPMTDDELRVARQRTLPLREGGGSVSVLRGDTRNTRTGQPTG